MERTNGGNDGSDGVIINIPMQRDLTSRSMPISKGMAILCAAMAGGWVENWRRQRLMANGNSGTNGGGETGGDQSGGQYEVIQRLPDGRVD